jgi:Zn-dependent protease with chaperone function
LVRRFLEGRVHPRTLVWTYLFGLLAAALATMLLLGALLLRYLPHDMLVRAGLSCALDDGCASALPPWADAGFSFLVGGIMVGLTAFFIVSFCAQVGCSRRHAKDSLVSARPFEGRVPQGLRGRVFVLDDSRPLSYAVGFVRTIVVVSAGLLATLDDRELAAVLAHEEGHVARRDNLVILLGHSLSLAFALLPGVRVSYAGLRRNLEIAADLFARDRVGDGIVVASSLHKFARLLVKPAATPLGAVVGFADEGHVGERIRGLLSDDIVVTAKRRFSVAVAVLMLLFAGFAGSAAAFTQVTFAHGSTCEICHPDSASTVPATPDHEACATAAH